MIPVAANRAAIGEPRPNIRQTTYFIVEMMLDTKPVKRLFDKTMNELLGLTH